MRSPPAPSADIFFCFDRGHHSNAVVGASQPKSVRSPRVRSDPEPPGPRYACGRLLAASYSVRPGRIAKDAGRHNTLGKLAGAIVQRRTSSAGRRRRVHHQPRLGRDDPEGGRHPRTACDRGVGRPLIVASAISVRASCKGRSGGGGAKFGNRAAESDPNSAECTWSAPRQQRRAADPLWQPFPHGLVYKSRNINELTRRATVSRRTENPPATSP